MAGAAPSVADGRRVARTLAEAEDLRPGWESLRASSLRPSLNADPLRYFATLASMSGHAEPWIATSAAGGRLRAMVIGRLSRRRPAISVGYLRVPAPPLACVDVVYGGVLAGDQPGDADEAAALLGLALDSGGASALTVNHLAKDDPARAPALAGPLRRAIAAPFAPHWRFALAPEGWDKTMARFSSKHRYNIKRTDRLLVEHFGGEVETRVFQTEADLPEFASGAAPLAARTYQAGLGAAFDDSPQWRSILGADARAGRMRCFWLVARGKPIAFQIGSSVGGVYFLESLGYDPDHRDHSPGTVLLLRSYALLAQEGVRTIDYGFGDAGYKRIYGTESWEESSVRVYGAGARAALAAGLDRAAEGISAAARRAMASGGTIDRVKKAWRKRLASPSPKTKPEAEPSKQPGEERS